jgi:hypothetical protein
MNKIQLFFLLRKNTKLSEKRHPMFEANQWGKLIGYIVLAFVAVEFIALGTFLGWLAAKESSPEMIFFVMPFLLNNRFLYAFCHSADTPHAGKTLSVDTSQQIHRHRLFPGIADSRLGQSGMDDGHTPLRVHRMVWRTIHWGSHRYVTVAVPDDSGKQSVVSVGTHLN